MERPTWGGRRKGAGRKPKGRVALVSHAARPELDGRVPVHVVMRVRDDVRSLRARATFPAILAAFAAGGERSGLRLTHYSVLGNHLHLIVEADDREALSRGIQGLAIRLARAINRAQHRKGRVFADHYFEHLLRTPAEARHAIRYVEQNQRLHELRAGRPVPAGVDGFSSAARDAPVCPPRTWLLRTGWRRARGAARWNDRVPP